MDRFSDEVCGRSLNPSVLLSQNDLYVVWQERRGRRTSIAMNDSGYPWTQWQTVAREILEHKSERVPVAPKLVLSDDQLFLTYFEYGAKRSPFQKNLQLGNLILKEIEVRSLVPN